MNNWIDKYCYFVVFLFIYLEWGYNPVVAKSISGITKTALMILSVLPLYFFEGYKIKTKSIRLFSYLSIIIIIRAIGDVEIGNSILLFVPIFCAFMITNAYPAERILHVFCNTITILATYSLVIYIVAWVKPSIVSSFHILPNPYNTPIYNLGLAVTPAGVNIIRNYGITWEPGAFALLLSLAIFGQIVGYESFNKRKIIINILALLSTLSTMGYVVLAAIVLITRFKTNAVSDSKSATLLLILFFGVSTLLLMSSSDLNDAIFGKLTGFSFAEDNNVETTQARINAIIYPGMAFLASPFFGVGYDVFRNINETLCDGVATNTIVNWFAIAGLMLGFPCAYFYFKAVLKLSSYLRLNLLFKIALVVTFALLISTESLLRISLIYVIIFYGCSVKHFTKNA